MNLLTYLEEKKTDTLGNDIEIQNFNIEYYALDPSTTADVVTVKETVSHTGGYKLRSFIHDLSKTIAQKQQGEVIIIFSMKDLIRNKTYNIEIQYTHNREKGIPIFKLKSNGRETNTNVNNIKINKSIIKPKEKILFNKIRNDAPKKFPEELFLKLMYLIFYSLKAILKTENYSKEI